MTRQPPLTRTGEPRAFFGRKSGKRLHVQQQALFDTLLPRLAIALTGAPLHPEALFAQTPGRLVLEIGYGGGEHLARQAKQNPETGFIGCEVFTGGIGKLLQSINEQGLGNIRLFADDALKLLMALPDACLDEAFLLYPDPWPKTRHFKRRFVSPTTLGELERVLKPGGRFHVATDIEDYANWTLAHILKRSALFWPRQAPGAWHIPFAGWQPTRYEQKARREGREKSFYFTFEKR